jgi:hypothetical protein
VQRFVITEVIRRSFAAGRNPDIIGAYTQLVLERRRRRGREHPHPLRRLQRTTCEFAVEGEEKIVRTPAAIAGVRSGIDYGVAAAVYVAAVTTQARMRTHTRESWNTHSFTPQPQCFFDALIWSFTWA